MIAPDRRLQIGSIEEMTVLWRPLPAAMAVQAKLAAADGEQV